MALLIGQLDISMVPMMAGWLVIRMLGWLVLGIAGYTIGFLDGWIVGWLYEYRWANLVV